MAIEIERKFLLTLPLRAWGVDVIATSAAAIVQGYLSEPSAALEVRVRRARPIEVDASGEPMWSSTAEISDATVMQWLAVKADIPTTEEGGVSRHELEVPITAADFDQAWRIVGRRVLRKVRMFVAVRSDAGDHYEVVVDGFSDRLEGLTIAEVEFDSWEASVRFRPPGFLGDEVTHDDRYRNANLADADAPPFP